MSSDKDNIGYDRAPACPVPDVGPAERITLAHGEGGRWMRRLIGETIRPLLGNAYLDAMGDAASLPLAELSSGQIAMTTDSFVVAPLFFPGGDIGKLAVYGTVNDLAVAGARPRWLSLAMIIEEGLPLATLQRVLASIAAGANQTGVAIITGDTKVVPRGAADGLFLTTTGIGELILPAPPGPTALEVGDALLVSGPIGRHGMAVMCARENLGFEPPPTSDCAPLYESVAALRAAQVPVRAVRDATRGGVAAVLHEWAASCGLTLAIDEARVPVDDDVRGVCELLGLDPIHVANEGTMVIAVPAADVEAALAALRAVPVSAAAALIGHVEKRGWGRKIPLDEPAGAPLPRIC
jgi:hydrogenase expression/formation protein HypE